MPSCFTIFPASLSVSLFRRKATKSRFSSQGACLPYMMKLFQTLLAHKSPFVRIEALQCLVQFSEVSL